MIFRGLKISIASDLVIILCLGMILVNFMTLSLWQQHIVKNSIDDNRHLLHNLKNMINDCEKLEDLIIRARTPSAPHPGRQLLFYHEYALKHGADKLPFDPTGDMTLSALGKTEVVKTYGQIVSYSGISPKHIIVAQPLEICGKRSSIGIFVNMKDNSSYISEKQRYIWVYILVNIIILTTLGFFRMRKTVVKPVEKLVKLSMEYQDDQEDIVTIDNDKTEFAHVAASLHAMLSRIERDKTKLQESIDKLENANRQLRENQRTLVNAEKFAAIGRLSAGLAHEIGNPLSIVQGYLELLRKESISDAEKEQFMLRSSKELERVSGLIRQLLDLSRVGSEQPQSGDAHDAIIELVSILKQQRSNENITFTVHDRCSMHQVQCGETELHQILLNCMINAIDAVNEAEENTGKVLITLENYATDEGEFVKIQIEDTGAGISEENLDSLFDPFFTTKEVGKGTGLGLSVTRSLVEGNGGTITIANREPGGSVVTLEFPVVTQEEYRGKTIG